MFTTAMGALNGSNYLNAAFDTGWLPAEEEDSTSATLKKLETWTKSGVLAITITGDRTARYKPGMKVKLDQDAITKYFTILSVSYLNPYTNLTLDGYGVYSLSDSAISNCYYSILVNPVGWPETWGVEPLGIVKEYYGSTLPIHHLWANGCTIGDANSGATGRANVDTINLFMVLWESVDNTNSQIKLYDSTGSLSAKGTSAIEDFVAHKRISLPDKRGRVGVGLDNMGGISANVVTNVKADILGNTDGEEKHALIASENGSHTHELQYIGISKTPTTSTTATGTGTFLASSTNTIGDNNGNILSVLSSGSGTAHNNMQPWVACNYIMRYC